MKNQYEVIVGNIGHVHHFSNKKEAIAQFNWWVADSKTGLGRSGGQSVSLFRMCGTNYDLIKEYIGPLEVADG